MLAVRRSSAKVERLFDRQKRTFLPRENLVVNGSGIQTVLGVAGQVSDAQQPKHFLKGKDREVVDLPAGIDQRASVRRPMF